MGGGRDGIVPYFFPQPFISLATNFIILIWKRREGGAHKKNRALQKFAPLWKIPEHAPDYNKCS